MKTTFCTITLACLMAGCIGHQPALFPLQPGEKVVFENGTRANAYRLRSGNDTQHTGSVVEVTRPCSVTTE